MSRCDAAWSSDWLADRGTRRARKGSSGGTGGVQRCMMEWGTWRCGLSVMRCREGRGEAVGTPRWVERRSPGCGAWFRRGTPDNAGHRRRRELRGMW